MLTAADDAKVCIWNLEDGSLVRRLVGHDKLVFSVCVSPDGVHVVTASDDGTARIWRLSDGSLVRTLNGHEGSVFSVCVSPDGVHVATASFDGTARIWRLSDGSLVRTLDGHLNHEVNWVCVVNTLVAAAAPQADSLRPHKRPRDGLQNVPLPVATSLTRMKEAMEAVVASTQAAEQEGAAERTVLQTDLARFRGELWALSGLPLAELEALHEQSIDACARIRACVEKTREEEKCCAVCMERPKDTALVPCGHLLCQTCAREVERCHVCRNPVTQRLRTYQ